MKAVQENNIEVHFSHITEVTEKEVIDNHGEEREVDAIICATGFDTSFRPPFPVVGKHGVDLRQKWADDANGYLGVAVPDFPNFVMSIGPAW